MARRNNDRRLVHHTCYGADFGAAVTALALSMDGFGMSDISVNPCAPRAMRLRRIAIHSYCNAVNSAGNWTWRLRKNESGSDSATFSFGMAAFPGSKDVGAPSTEVVLQAGETYHVLADGPSRNLAGCRVTMEWEVL